MRRVYAQILGASFDKMPATWRAVHGPFGKVNGEISVTLPRNIVLRLLARLAGFPPACQNTPFTFETAPHGKGERWIRRIGNHTVTTQIWATPDGLLAERMGPVTAFTALCPNPDGGVDLRLDRMHVLGVALPRALRARITASDGADAGRYGFEIAVHLPFHGNLLASYRGWLDPSR